MNDGSDFDEHLAEELKDPEFAAEYTKAVSAQWTEACPVCGTPVRVVGSVTKSYESAYFELLMQAARLQVALEEWNLWEYEEAPISRTNHSRLDKLIKLTQLTLKDFTRWKEGR